MKYVITVMNIWIGLTQCGLIWEMLRYDSIMKLINLLIKELDNFSLGADFWISRHAEICQFDRFSLEINFKRARSCNYGIPRLVQVKMKIPYQPSGDPGHLQGGGISRNVNILNVTSWIFVVTDKVEGGGGGSPTLRFFSITFVRQKL